VLASALVHRSWCAENAGYESNERLEFLGDAVLGLIVTDHAFHAYKSLSEGELTDVRKAVVNAVTLAEVADELGCRSLALPAFGTGVGGFPLVECARVMVGAVRAHEPRVLETVVFAVFGEDARRAFAAALE